MPKKYLSIKRNDSAKQLEQYYLDPDLGKYILRFPSKIQWGGSIGQSASLTQLIATWASRCDTPSLKLFMSPDESQTHVNFLSSLHGLSAVYFSDQVSGEKSESNIRHKMLKQAFPRIDAMWKRDYKKVSKRRTVELVSVVGAQREFLPALYSRQPTVEDLLDRQRHGQLVSSSQQMTGIFLKCMKLLNVPYRSASLISPLSNNELIGELLYEAFRNTAEHAYLTEDGGMPYRGLRCILFKIHSIDRERVRELTPFSMVRSDADKYFDHIESLRREYSRKRVDFLEISILDSGPGFAATMHQSTPDLDETALVASCFESHKSRKLGGNSGLGLYRILSAVKNLDGFIRIRTSTCEAFFCASGEADENSILKPKIYGQFAMVVGTLLTVSIPIVY